MAAELFDKSKVFVWPVAIKNCVPDIPISVLLVTIGARRINAVAVAVNSSPRYHGMNLFAIPAIPNISGYAKINEVLLALTNSPSILL